MTAERLVPGGGDLRTGRVVEGGVEWCHAPIRRPGGGS